MPPQYSLELPFSRKIVAGFYEDHNEKERCNTLHEALQAAVQDLDQEYTSVEGLKTVFQEWKSKYPEDYKQCFASLSLGDLLALFLRADFCKSSWFSTILSEAVSQNGSGVVPFSKDVEASLGDSHVIDDDCRGRALEKSVIPFLKGSMETYPACALFLSQKKSEMMSNLVSVARNHSKGQTKILEKAICDAVVKSLDAVAVPILNNTSPEVENDAGATAEFALQFSKNYLVGILQEMLCNMINYWFPLLTLESEDSNNGIHAVLTFANEKFLMLLSSIENDESRHSFEAVWQALRKDPRNLLASPSLLLMTMPLRAAATAYGLA